MNQYLHGGTNLCTPCGQHKVTYKLLQSECTHCKDLVDIARTSPIAFAAGIKHCFESNYYSDLEDLRGEVEGLEGIGKAPLGVLRDESELHYRRDVAGFFTNVGWFIAFIFVFGLAISAVLKIREKCRNKEDIEKEGRLNWEELEMTPKQDKSHDSANITGSAVATPTMRREDHNNSNVDATDIADITLRMDNRQVQNNGTPATGEFTSMEMDKPSGPKLLNHLS